MSVLRSSLIPGLLETMKKNMAQQETTLKFFEIGKVFFATQKGSLPVETEMVAGLITGNRSDQTWHSKKSEVDFFDLKGVLEGFFNVIMIPDLSFEKVEEKDICPYYKNGYAAFVKSNEVCIGTLGKIDEKVLKNYGLKQDAYVFDLEFRAMMNLIPEFVTAVGLPRFPSISRDITIIVGSTVQVGAILDQLDRFVQKEALIEKVFLFDLFEGKPLAQGKKSLSFRIVYRSESKTLKEKNIQKLHSAISGTLLELFDAALPD
jgi:phenylalanyl-tRNA synthetase beta chain